MALTSSSSVFKVCGSLRQILCISPMSSSAKETSSKRPRTAFALFWSSKMDHLPKGKNGLLEASRLWRTMSVMEKEPFHAIYRKEKDNFVEPVLSEQDVTERSIRALKRKVRKYSKERKEILSGRVFKKKVSPYNIFVAEAWSGSKGNILERESSQKWKDLTPSEMLKYEKKAKAINDTRDLEYGKNPLTEEEEIKYVELSDNILKLKREINALEKSISEDK